MRLVEYENHTARLPPQDLAYLLTLVKGGSAAERGLFQSITPTNEPDVFELRPGPFVGRLGLPSGAVLDFETRFNFRDLVDLLARAGRFPTYLDPVITELGQGVLLVDIIAESFAREVEKIAGVGLAKAYVRRRFVSPPYPGQLDAVFHITRQMARADKLATRASRLTPRIPLNEALAQAIDVLALAPVHSQLLRRRIARLGSSFRGIPRRPRTPPQVRRLRPTRLHAYYRDALALAATIIEGGTLIPRGGGLAGSSVLFYMPRVWESIVHQWVREQHNQQFRVEAGSVFELTADGSMKFQTDVLVYKGNRPVHLYDAKYKVPGSSPDVPDVYQMVTYCERLNLPGATLVYPARIASKSFRVGTKFVAMVGLDDVLAADF